jgi:thiol-disulfide isomerase/thioredoxin
VKKAACEVIMKNYLYIIIGLLLTSLDLNAKGIEFHNDILEEALAMAKSQGKYVFIDTYAPWCAPCKRMNKVFTDPKVGTLFNDKFINVKINMDGNLGKEMLIKYDVIWLPTLLILDHEGNIKYKVDKEVPADDLIRMANDALNPNFTFYNAPAYSSSPLAKTPTPKTQKKIILAPATSPKKKEPEVKLGIADIPEKAEKILYVYDENSTSKDPEILYHEAYLQMQLMDPKMYIVADKYLSTQKDWSTEKNVRFIFDFVENVHSKYFEFFTSNLKLFEKYLGEESVLQNLQMMIYMKLNNGFPRPGLSEALHLYGLIDKERGVDKAHLYYMQRLKGENKIEDLLLASDNYLHEINPYNAQVIKEFTLLKLENNLKGLPNSLRFIDKALEKQKSNTELLLLRAKVLNSLGKGREAKSVAKKALRILQEKNQDSAEIKAFLSELS